MAIVSLRFQQLHLTPAMSAFRTLRLGKYHSNGLQRNSVPARAGSHFLSFPGFSASEEIIFFANLEAKTLLVFVEVFAQPGNGPLSLSRRELQVGAGPETSAV